MNEVDAKLMKIFMPYAMERIEAIQERNGRFVHYTNAANALNIIKTKQVWMRNARGMVDYMEVEHGFSMLRQSFSAPERMRAFQDAFDLAHAGVAAEALKLFEGWLPEVRINTFITCLSEHDDKEDELGRLSMWRASGQGSPRVALVVNRAPFLSTADVLKAYSSPVSYLSVVEFQEQFDQIIVAVKQNSAFLSAQSRETILARIFNMLLFACVCSKHPGFLEEREWRVLYVPRQHQSPIFAESVEVIGDIPQIICKIPLKDVPDQGLVGIEIPAFLERLIIGPSAFAGPLYQAFVRALSEAGVANATDKVVMSNIPLRS